MTTPPMKRPDPHIEITGPPSPQVLRSRLTFIAVNLVQILVHLLALPLSLPFTLLRALLRALTPCRRKHPTARSRLPPLAVTVRNPAARTPPKGTVLLLHGFPDNETVWSPTVRALAAAGYRCLLPALPGANGERLPAPLPTYDDFLSALEARVRAEVGEGAVTVVAHDWGAVLARRFVARWPALCERVVYADVGALAKRGEHWSARLCVVSYQTSNVLGYVLGRPVGTLLFRLVQAVTKYDVRPIRTLQSDYYWLYYRLAKDIARWFVRPGVAGVPDMYALSGRGDEARGREVPTLFVYGKGKPFMFHDAEWVRFVRATPNGDVVAMEGGHWFFVSDFERWMEIVNAWLSKTDNM